VPRHSTTPRPGGHTRNVGTRQSQNEDVRHEIDTYCAIAKETFRAVGEMAQQLEAESERERQYLFIAALRSMAVHGEQLMVQSQAALNAPNAQKRIAKALRSPMGEKVANS
jgi:hypothetical protein